jgi:hypothetical protein
LREVSQIFKEAQTVDYTITEEEMAPGSGDWTTPCRLKLPHHLYKLHILVACFKDYAIRTIKSRELFFTNLPLIFQSTTKSCDQFYAWHRWDKNPLKNRETVKVPLMGHAMEGILRGNMMVTHLLVGFGKDHNPKN